jgi:CRISPR/Cas system-associated exonuclease Cas4 (RecB family)
MLTSSTEQAPERREDLWAYVSPTRLNTWICCPLKFKLRYLEHIPMPSNPSLFLGKQVHAGLECYYRHRQVGITLTPEELSASILANWDQAVDEEQLKFLSIADEAALRCQAVQLLSLYVEQVAVEEPLPIAIETTLETPLVDPRTGEDLGIPLLGVVDLILDSAVIVDFKTSSRSLPPSEVMHEVQLSCYSHLFHAATGQHETGLEIRSLIKTKQPKVETHRYPTRTERHLGRLFALIREYLDALDAGRFNYRPSWNCGMCAFQDGPCKAWTS